MNFLTIVCLIVFCFVLPSMAIGLDMEQPIARVSIEPMDFNAGTGVKVVPELRIGSDEISFEYRWYVNGDENNFETESFFPGTLMVRGDELSVDIVPFDREGKPFKKISIHDMEVGNSAPMISSGPSVSLTTTGYTYQVNATDPDGDILTFNLEEAPEGMKIDPATGQITWQFDTMPQGVFQVKIIVEDGFDGRAEQTFELNLSLVEKKGTQ